MMNRLFAFLTMMIVVLGIAAVITKPRDRPSPRDEMVILDAPGQSTPMPVRVSTTPGSVPAGAVTAQPVPRLEGDADEAGLADLLRSQQRNVGWADAAEHLIRNQLGGAGAIECLEYMCRVSVALPPASAERTPDEQAAALAAGWPAISYNPYTASTTDGVRGKALTFYVTRTDLTNEEEDGVLLK